MPNSSTSRDKTQMGRLSEKSASFHGKNSSTTHPQLRRPKTETELLCGKKFSGGVTTPIRLTKLLLNVTIQRSLGAVQVVISSESTVGDLIAAAVRQYVKEERRPLLSTTDPAKFDLHYSSFSLESLDRDDKLISLGSRNFFMCPTNAVDVDEKTTVKTASSSSCSNQADKASKVVLPWSGILQLFN